MSPDRALIEPERSRESEGKKRARLREKLVLEKIDLYREKKVRWAPPAAAAEIDPHLKGGVGGLQSEKEAD